MIKWGFSYDRIVKDIIVDEGSPAMYMRKDEPLEIDEEFIMTSVVVGMTGDEGKGKITDFFQLMQR